MDVVNEVKVVENEQDFDRTKLKEERKLRNKLKKAAKKLHKQKEREQKELILKLQVKSNNVTLITRDLADKVAGNSSTTGSFGQHTVNNDDFPALGARCKVSSLKSDSFPKAVVETDDEKKRLSKIELSDFLYMPTTSKHVKPTAQTVQNYNGNPLDSDMPIRKRGKYREVPKMKKLSKLKREILKDKSEHKQGEFQKLSEDVNLCDNIITQELNDLVTTFLVALVGLQEKLYKRDSIKGKSKRRYVVGLHEVKKHLNLNKVKMLIMAPDIKLVKHDDGAINCAIKEVIDLAKTNNTPYLYALKRGSLGAITLKQVPVSCVAILNYEGLEDYYNHIIKFLPSLKKDNCDKNIATDDANQKFLNNLMQAYKCDD